MTWRQAAETPLSASLRAVLLLLYEHVAYYLNHSHGQAIEVTAQKFS